MAMSMLIPIAVSTGLNIYGQYKAGEAAEAGADAQARIERMNQAYQQRVFDKNIEMQKPFYEAGVAAIPTYGEAVRGRGKPMESGLAQMQRGLLQKDTGSMSEHVQNMTMKGLEAVEGEKQKARLMDLQQIGLGSAGSAGRSAVNLGSALAGSAAREGGAMASAQLNRMATQQNMWLQSLDALSGLPAYYAMNRTNRQPLPNAPMQSGYVGDFPTLQQQGAMYA